MWGWQWGAGPFTLPSPVRAFASWARRKLLVNATWCKSGVVFLGERVGDPVPRINTKTGRGKKAFPHLKPQNPPSLEKDDHSEKGRCRGGRAQCPSPHRTQLEGRDVRVCAPAPCPRAVCFSWRGARVHAAAELSPCQARHEAQARARRLVLSTSGAQQGPVLGASGGVGPPRSRGRRFARLLLVPGTRRRCRRGACPAPGSSSRVLGCLVHVAAKEGCPWGMRSVACSGSPGWKPAAAAAVAQPLHGPKLGGGGVPLAMLGAGGRC